MKDGYGLLGIYLQVVYGILRESPLYVNYKIKKDDDL